MTMYSKPLANSRDFKVTMQLMNGGGVINKVLP